MANRHKTIAGNVPFSAVRERLIVFMCYDFSLVIKTWEVMSKEKITKLIYFIYNQLLYSFVSELRENLPVVD